jgi:hypothetical protein
MKTRVRLVAFFSVMHLVACGSRPAGLPWVVDAAPSADAGLPWLADAGATDSDAGSPRQDGGSSDDGGGVDAGSVSPDGGTGDGGSDGGVVDAGVGTPDGGGAASDGGALPSLDAALVGATLPIRVLPGATATAELDIRNTGAREWTNTDVRLVSQNDPAAMWGVVEAPLPASPIAAGADTRFTLRIQAPPLPGRYSFRWRMSGAAGAFGRLFDLAVEVTCDDGVFCNGVERFVEGSCIAGPPPCDDRVDCTTDSCDEVARRCTNAVAASGCNVCSACVPHCEGRVCGSNGCGGQCGTCEDPLRCVDGQCAAAPPAGTCAAPTLIDSTGTQIIVGDTGLGEHHTSPTCAPTAEAREQVYLFKLTEPTVVDARVEGFDTVLSVRSACDEPASTIACNDDSDPPGWPGSRIARAFDAGDYYLIVDGYARDSQGRFTLNVKFSPGTCVASCDNRFCGSDGCGGTCGSCVTGACGSDGRCADACARECEGKVCGSTSCGTFCGTCADGQICTGGGQCVPGAACDHFRPTCEPPCGAGRYCGTDCVCRDVSAPLPDLIVVRDALRNGLSVESNTFRTTSCPVIEGCVAEPGVRRIMRFEVRVANVGHVDLDLGRPSQHPERYTWSPCHRHFHFSGFAEYELRDASGAAVVRGRKQAFCLEDITRIADSPAVSCRQNFTCNNQGIQRGWADVYSARLDCQWLDVTDVPAGRYKLVVRVNPERIIEELTLDNNEASIDVTLQ